MWVSKETAERWAEKLNEKIIDCSDIRPKAKRLVVYPTDSEGRPIYQRPYSWMCPIKTYEKIMEIADNVQSDRARQK